LYKIINEDLNKVTTDKITIQEKNIDFISRIFFPVNHVIQIKNRPYIIEKFKSAKLNIPGGDKRKINTIFKSTVNIEVYEGDKILKPNELYRRGCIKKAKDLDIMARRLGLIDKGSDMFIIPYGKKVIKKYGTKKRYKNKAEKLEQLQKGIGGKKIYSKKLSNKKKYKI